MPVAQPLYPHTLTSPPSGDEDTPLTVDVDALCDAFDRSGTSVMYINTHLSEADAQAMFDSHELVAEFDAVRGVDAIRHATDEELATAEASQAAKAPAKTSPVAEAADAAEEVQAHAQQRRGTRE
jgi:hypothetical protein